MAIQKVSCTRGASLLPSPSGRLQNQSTLLSSAREGPALNYKKCSTAGGSHYATLRNTCCHNVFLWLVICRLIELSNQGHSIYTKCSSFNANRSNWYLELLSRSTYQPALPPSENLSNCYRIERRTGALGGFWGFGSKTDFCRAENNPSPSTIQMSFKPFAPDLSRQLDCFVRGLVQFWSLVIHNTFADFW